MSEDVSGKRVIKKIGDSHVIWFPESNRWVEFREPAWFIYKNFVGGNNEKEIAEKLEDRYGLPGEEAHRFCMEVINGIELSSRLTAINPTGEISVKSGKTEDEITEPFAGNSPVKEKEDFIESFRSRRFTQHYYRINNCPFRISYGSSQLAYYIHRPLAHLEVPAPEEEPFSIMLYEDRNYHLKITPPGSGNSRYFSFDNSGILKQRVYVAITSHIYNIRENDWMSYIHASAVSSGTESILLSSASGSGKSTMAALLQLPVSEAAGKNQRHPEMSAYDNNYPGNQDEMNDDGIKFRKSRSPDLYFLSDDFVPVAATDLKAYPFPAAITVKEGSFEVIKPFYRQEDDADAGYPRSHNSRIRYLRPRFPERQTLEGKNINKIIFIKFNRGAAFSLKKLDAAESLATFHEEAWVSQNPGHAQRFIDWFVRLSCYRLEYSDNRQAVEAIRKMFTV